MRTKSVQYAVHHELTVRMYEHEAKVELQSQKTLTLQDNLPVLNERRSFLGGFCVMTSTILDIRHVLQDRKIVR